MDKKLLKRLSEELSPCACFDVYLEAAQASEETDEETDAALLRTANELLEEALDATSKD